MNVLDDVPFALADIDAAWLTRALREGGHLADAEVTDLDIRVIGEETGFMGQVAILTPTYSADEGAPASMVLKIPVPNKTRVFGQTMGAYEREIRFYSGLRDDVGVRSPKFYYGALSAFDEPDVALERLIALVKQPIWVIAILALIVRFIFGLMPRRYVLLIEDVGYLRIGDQEKGCNTEDIKTALASMAKLHAGYWAREAPEKELPWIPPMQYSAKLIHMGYMQSIAGYKKVAWDALSDRQKKLIDWVGEHGMRMTEELGKQPATLLHQDMRLDNICFDDETGEALFLDWQTVNFGSSGLEVAYFLSSALAADHEDETVEQLIDHYLDCLESAGVTVSREHFRWTFDVGMLVMLHRIAPVLHQEQLELGSGRGPIVMKKWLDCIYRRLESVDFENILERRPAS